MLRASCEGPCDVRACFPRPALRASHLPRLRIHVPRRSRPSIFARRRMSGSRGAILATAYPTRRSLLAPLPARSTSKSKPQKRRALAARIALGNRYASRSPSQFNVQHTAPSPTRPTALRRLARADGVYARPAHLRMAASSKYVVKVESIMAIDTEYSPQPRVR